MFDHFETSHVSTIPNISFGPLSTENGSAGSQVSGVSALCQHLLAERLNQTPSRFIDIPGHERLRARSLAQYYSAASSIVIVLDAVNGLNGRAVKEACDHLQLILGLSTHERSPHLGVLLTKMDLLKDAKSEVLIARAKATMEREMDKRRIANMSSTTARVEGLSSSNQDTAGDEAEILAKAGPEGSGAWTWESRLPDVTWMSGSSVEGKELRKQVLEWLR